MSYLIKTILPSCIIGVLLFTGCSDKEENEGEMSTFEKLSALKNMGKELEKISEEGDTLKNTTPVSQDELAELIPETVGYIKQLPRISLEAGKTGMSNLSMVTAVYEDDEELPEHETRPRHKVTFSITDGAGEMGATMTAALRLSLATNYYKGDENHYEKTTMTTSQKILETQTKDQEIRRHRYDSKIMYLVADRFMVTIESNRVKVSVLKKMMLNNEHILKKLYSIAKKK